MNPSSYPRFAPLLCLLVTLAHAAPLPQVAAQLQPFVDSHTLAGAVTLVATKDEVLSLEGVGSADIAAQKPMQTDALFWIASMSKPITATALMMLVDEGKVKVDDPVEKYLPEFKGQMFVAEKDALHALLKKPAHLITVKNILSHTSGLTPRTPLEPQIDILSLRENVWSYPMLPLKFEPDSKYEYSNAGINTAGRIVEVVSGMKFEDFLDARLFRPLGMKDTTFWPNAGQMKRLAKSYKPNADKTALEEVPILQLTYPLTDRRRSPCPAGGLFSTATDVAMFGRMILRGGELDGKRYLSEAAVKQMTATQTGDLPQTYGLGWSTDKKPGGPFGHGGAYATNLRIDPEHRLVTVFMVQHVGWRNEDGKKILPIFQTAATDAFAR